MSGELCLRNRQRTRNVDLRLLRQVINRLLASPTVASNFDLTVHLVGDQEMTRINETRLRHAGSTDVITFDYGDHSGPLAGELFVCVDEAIRQAVRFRATWQEEIVRYIIHGILHLEGYDDLRSVARRKMKSEESRRLKQLARDFRLSKLTRKTKVVS